MTELEGRAIAAVEEGQRLGVTNFLKSDDFMADLAILNTHVLQHGYSQALDEIHVLNLPEFDLGQYPKYNSIAVDQLDRLVEGYSKGYKLADLVADPSLPISTLEEEWKGSGESQTDGAKVLIR